MRAAFLCAAVLLGGFVLHEAIEWLGAAAKEQQQQYQQQMMRMMAS